MTLLPKISIVDFFYSCHFIKSFGEFHSSWEVVCFNQEIQYSFHGTISERGHNCEKSLFSQRKEWQGKCKTTFYRPKFNQLIKASSIFIVANTSHSGNWGILQKSSRFLKIILSHSLEKNTWYDTRVCLLANINASYLATTYKPEHLHGLI